MKITQLPDGWRRLATCLTMLSIFINHSNAIRLFGLQDYKLYRKPHNFSYELTTVCKKWIDQPIDHFNKSDTRTFKMQFIEALEFWEEKSPVYVFLVGESPSDDIMMRGGIMADLAHETNGAMYVIEHRYYGDSMPFKNVTAENLAYLSSRQALADLANFMKQIKMDPKFNESKIVVIGGSYGGNLAVWFKRLYPDLVDAVIASSAPVLAKKDFYEYIDTVNNDFKKYASPECYKKISDTFHRYERLLKTSEGQEKLKKECNICESADLNKDLNRQLFFIIQMRPFFYLAQYGAPTWIGSYCKTWPRSPKPGEQCSHIEFENEMSNWKLQEQEWLYQACTEFGYFMTSPHGNNPFTNNINLNFYINMCTYLYGPEFDERRIDEGIKRSNEIYGGLQPNVSHVVFVNGDFDPYHRLGILKDLSPDAPALLLNGTSHCSDLAPFEEYNSEQLKKAKKYIKSLIKKWIGYSKVKN